MPILVSGSGLGETQTRALSLFLPTLVRCSQEFYYLHLGWFLKCLWNCPTSTPVKYVDLLTKLNGILWSILNFTNLLHFHNSSPWLICQSCKKKVRVRDGSTGFARKSLLQGGTVGRCFWNSGTLKPACPTGESWDSLKTHWQEEIYSPPYFILWALRNAQEIFAKQVMDLCLQTRTHQRETKTHHSTVTISDYNQNSLYTPTSTKLCWLHQTLNFREVSVDLVHCCMTAGFFFSVFPEYRDVCGLSLKGPNWLIYTSQRAKPFSTSIRIPSENLHTRDSKFSPDQRVLGLGQSQSWYQQQLSPGPGCLRAASVVHCHQGI